MGFKELQKNLPVFSISVVTKITQLTARQIRYYEEKNSSLQNVLKVILDFFLLMISINY